MVRNSRVKNEGLSRRDFNVENMANPLACIAKVRLSAGLRVESRHVSRGCCCRARPVALTYLGISNFATSF